ncbi:hypothetical protein F9948_23970 [Burkholderia thailandensis]|nr:hypothetical protein [Burkholderia thailandensis]MDD1489394.1 hypothetical protein [Burkholderia thailandensis]MDD1495567.1 hypothetical protein [Burkholderia thailandensis]
MADKVDTAGTENLRTSRISIRRDRRGCRNDVRTCGCGRRRAETGQKTILALRRPAGPGRRTRDSLAERAKNRVRGRDIGRMETSNSLQ